MTNIQPIVARNAQAPEETVPAKPGVASGRSIPPPEEEHALVSAPRSAEPVPGSEQWSEAVANLHAALEEVRPPEWRVDIHEDLDTGTVVVEIKDLDGETIKQFPPEKILNLQRRLADLSGMVLDEAH